MTYIKNMDMLQNIIENQSAEKIVIQGLQRFLGTKCNDYDQLIFDYKHEKFNELQRDVNYFIESIIDIKQNWSHYKMVYSKLYDSESKEAFLGMLYAKIFMDPNYIEGIYTNEIPYFDERIWGGLTEEIFLDCGGYNGDTAIKFVNCCPQYKKIVVFEPLPEAAEQCKKRLEYLIKEGNLEVKQNAVSDKNKSVRMYCGEMKGDSKIDKDGEMDVQAVALDEIINEPVTLIKMDIEGSEKEAILGCKKLIQKYTPKLAICIYHLKDDFWRIPELIMSINENYNFKIRQHDPEVYSETILYCIPQSFQNENIHYNYIQIAKRLNFAKKNLYFYDPEEQKNIVQHVKDKKWFLYQIRQYEIRERELKSYIKKLEEGKKWLENQVNNYKLLSSNQQLQIEELKNWIEELENGKNWIEKQWKKAIKSNDSD